VGNVRGPSGVEKKKIAWLRDTHTFIVHDVNAGAHQRFVKTWSAQKRHKRSEHRAYVLIEVARGKEGSVLERLGEIEYVARASAVFGDYDIIATIQTETAEQREITAEKIIRNMEGVDSIATFTVWYANGQSLYWDAPDEQDLTQSETALESAARDAVAT
jgi:hypothetical protein